MQSVLPAGELEAHVLEYAGRVARNAPIPIEAAWVALRAAREPGVPAWRDELELLKERAITSDDYAEGVRAFLEKRPARFVGR